MIAANSWRLYIRLYARPDYSTEMDIMVRVPLLKWKRFAWATLKEIEVLKVRMGRKEGHQLCDKLLKR